MVTVSTTTIASDTNGDNWITIRVPLSTVSESRVEPRSLHTMNNVGIIKVKNLEYVTYPSGVSNAFLQGHRAVARYWRRKHANSQHEDREDRVKDTCTVLHGCGGH